MLGLGWALGYFVTTAVKKVTGLIQPSFNDDQETLVPELNANQDLIDPLFAIGQFYSDSDDSDSEQSCEPVPRTSDQDVGEPAPNHSLFSRLRGYLTRDVGYEIDIHDFLLRLGNDT
ncbi:uncharacterized protein V6R79_023613 [Siganus canaliculatus]